MHADKFTQRDLAETTNTVLTLAQVMQLMKLLKVKCDWSQLIYTD